MRLCDKEIKGLKDLETGRGSDKAIEGIGNLVAKRLNKRLYETLCTLWFQK